MAEKDPETKFAVARCLQALGELVSTFEVLDGVLQMSIKVWRKLSARASVIRSLR